MCIWIGKVAPVEHGLLSAPPVPGELWAKYLYIKAPFLIVPYRAQGSSYMSMEERCQILQKSASLRALFEDICYPNMGLPLQTHRYHLRSYHNCFLGSELVDWLLAQNHAATR
jgi:hypothetical protein